MAPKIPRKHIKIQVENVQTPENWEILYNNILEMRKEKTAPVDTMGCEKVQELSTDPKVCFRIFKLNILPLILVFLGTKVALLGLAYAIITNQR